MFGLRYNTKFLNNFWVYFWLEFLRSWKTKMKDIFGVILRATKDNTILATFGGFPGSTELCLRMLFLCAAKILYFCRFPTVFTCICSLVGSFSTVFRLISTLIISEALRLTEVTHLILPAWTTQVICLQDFQVKVTIKERMLYFETWGDLNRAFQGDFWSKF